MFVLEKVPWEGDLFLGSDPRAEFSLRPQVFLSPSLSLLRQLVLKPAV